MNKRQAERDPKARIVMVYEPGSPLSRGGARGGYSAYADDMYSALKFIKECEGIHLRHEAALRILKEEYVKKVEQCVSGYKSRIEKLNEALKVAGHDYTVTPIDAIDKELAFSMMGIASEFKQS